MQNIYNILSKHFLHETSEQEEQQITEFKKTNSTEYNILKKLWIRGDIEVKDFDSSTAWKAVQDKATHRKTKSAKIILLYQKLRRIAAVAAILIIGTTASYFFVHTNKTPETIAQALISESGKLVLLSDGSQVWLNRNATLTYPEKFEKHNRKVELKGEAFFEVSKNPEKPFIVSTSNSSVEVLGTSFNINSNSKKTEVTVTTGKVKVTNANKSNNVIITKGLSAIVSGTEVEKYQTENINYLSWKTGEFVFKDVAIEKVIEDLNTYYPEQLRVGGSTGNNCLLTVSFSKAKIEEVIEIIELTCDVKIISNNNK